jgi:Flp pilus assembly protein TadG
MARRPPRPSRRGHDDAGAVLVEFAWAFPVLMLVTLFALFAMWAMFLQVEAGQAAREGARYASVALAPTYRTHPDAAAVAARVKNRVQDLHLTNADVAVTYPACGSPCPNPPANTPVVVTVTKHLSSFFLNITIKATSAGEVRAE